MHDSPYVGPPSVDLDRAWQNLVANMSIRVTKAELERRGQSSVALPGGGHLAWLGVFHQLHCVVGLIASFACSLPFSFRCHSDKLMMRPAEDASAVELLGALPSKHDCERDKGLACACGSLSRAPAGGNHVSRGHNVSDDFHVAEDRETDAE